MKSDCLYDSQKHKVKKMILQKLYADILEKLEKVEKFLENTTYQNCHQKKQKNVNHSPFVMLIEFVTKIFPAKKTSGPDSFSVEFSLTF